MSEGKAHDFGGDWTSKKLDVLTGYLGAYRNKDGAPVALRIANHLLEKLR